MSPNQKNRLTELFTAHAADSLTPEEHAELQTHLRNDAEARRWWFVHQDVEIGLRAQLAAERVTTPKSAITWHWPAITWHWLSWRPLTAAAAGLFVGMFCTSVVYGLVAGRNGVHALPLPLVGAGFDDPQLEIGGGEPTGIGEWSGERASVVAAENGVKPVDGTRMVRIGQFSPEQAPQARLHQMIDLRSVPTDSWADDAEVKVEAAFCASDDRIAARFKIRVCALDESPEDASQGFWSRVHSSKIQDDDLVVSSAQWFPVKPGEPGWHRFSLKLPLPRGMKTLVILFGAGHARDTVGTYSSYYLDDVRVSLLSRQPTLP